MQCFVAYRKEETSVNTVFALIKTAPRAPGVYLFKDDQGAVLYVGKARSLHARLQSYRVAHGTEWKATSIIDASATVQWHETKTELDALLLEARLIQSYQPPFNILLKTGHPYVYFMITRDPVPVFMITRVKSKKGTYFGPFIDKGAARSAFRFLQQSFRLFVCGRAVPGGCLAYHLGRCAGTCRQDFNKAEYEQRLELLKQALTSSPQEALASLEQAIHASNQAMTFERSAQLVGYRHALEKMYASLATGFDRPLSIQKLAEKDIWIWRAPEEGAALGYLFLFRERQGVLKKERVFSVPVMEESDAQEMSSYLFSYYRLYRPSPQILVSHAVSDSALLADFAREWHTLSYDVVVNAPAREAHHEVMAHAYAYAEAEYLRPEKMARHLKHFLKLSRLPRRIDCFDISHKQGRAMVGACVRFTDGKPDKGGIRHFHIKTLQEQNDYAALQEIVQRRYRSREDLPDLIVIDGGKGQLSAVRAVLDPLLAGTDVGLVSLAKREETVFSAQFPEGKILTGQLVTAGSLVALRDYAHHRAVSFHRVIEKKL